MVVQPIAQGLPTTPIGGFAVIDTDAPTLVSHLQTRLARRERTELHFANTNFVLGCTALRDALQTSNTLIVNDGIGMDLASRMLRGRAFTTNLNGTDFTPALLEAVSVPARVFLVGGTADAVRGAATELGKLPCVEIVGSTDGFAGLCDDDTLVAEIARTRPDILLIALGNPLQEQWIVTHRDRVDVPLVIGVGALFDFLSGRSRRAPLLLRRLRLEWLHRLACEPRRLMRRYTVDLARFFVHVLRMRRTETHT